MIYSYQNVTYAPKGSPMSNLAVSRIMTILFPKIGRHRHAAEKADEIDLCVVCRKHAPTPYRRSTPIDERGRNYVPCIGPVCDGCADRLNIE